MDLSRWEAFAFGQLRITPRNYYSMGVYEFENAIEGYYYQQELEASRFRMLYSLTYNMNVEKKDKKSAVRLWPLPRIDKNILDPVKAKTTTEGQIHLLEGMGFEADWSIIDPKDISWLRYFAQNRIKGPNDWLPNGETVEGNKEKIKEFCKEKGIQWQTEK